MAAESSPTDAARLLARTGVVVLLTLVFLGIVTALVVL